MHEGDSRYEWHRNIQRVVDRIDTCIQAGAGEALTLKALAEELGYSPYHATRRFREMAGQPLREYVRGRRLAFALIQLRDTRRTILDIALDHGFSSHEAFTRAFKKAYGIAPAAYRKRPRALVLRTRVITFDRYLLGVESPGNGEIGMAKSEKDVKVYFVSIPAHRFLYVKNYNSEGYFDFWEKQAGKPGLDCESVCGLLDSVKGKLDGDDGVIGRFSGQIMARIPEQDGRRPQCYGVRLPANWAGEVPAGFALLDVAQGEYVVYEHGPFDYDTESEQVQGVLEKTVAAFHLADEGRAEDTTPGRPWYFYFDPEQFHKLVYPVRPL